MSFITDYTTYKETNKHAAEYKEIENGLFLGAFFRKTPKWKFKCKKIRHYKFKTFSDFKTKADSIIEEIEQRNKRRDNIKEKNKQIRKDTIKLFVDSLKVGDIFVNSWGYNMTIVESYQIVKKQGQRLTIRQIKNEVTSWDPWYTGEVRPVKDRFIEDKEEIIKNITPSWLSFEYWSVRLWDGKECFYFNKMD